LPSGWDLVINYWNPSAQRAEPADTGDESASDDDNNYERRVFKDKLVGKL